MTVAVLVAVKESINLSAKFKRKIDAMRHVEVVSAILYFRDANR